MAKIEYIDTFNMNPLIIGVRILEGSLETGDTLPQYGTIESIERNYERIQTATSDDGNIVLRFITATCATRYQSFKSDIEYARKKKMQSGRYILGQ